MSPNTRAMKIIGVPENASASVEQVSSENGIDLYRFRVDFPEKLSPSPITVSWEESMTDILWQWTPLGARERALHQWFGPTCAPSRFCFGAPVLNTSGYGGRNRQTVAVSDAVTPLKLRFGVDDLSQRDTVEYSVEFFSETTDEMSGYTALIRVDTRDIPFYEAVMSVSGWWESCGLAVPECPPAAEDPLYSSWYNFHQVPSQEPLLADLRIAARAGFRTVILDDGWQFDGPSSGNYSMCGEWRVAKSKFPDFGRFVRETHDLGMRLMVWFTVPFVGVDSPMYSRFEGKYLYYNTGCRAAVLDPRYPSVRQEIVGSYGRFLREYDIDGFKLDFVDSFFPGDLTAPYDPSVMDCETVGDGVRRLLLEITEGLGEIKPDLLYEYRQNYVGPAINRYGNMLRVCDCAYDALTNRIAIADLRLLNYPIAVHSDMLFWAREESVTLCAGQLLNIMFGVPQISVILANSTGEQLKLLRRYLAYWTENRDLLLHGSFRAFRPEMNYTRLSAEDGRKRITVLYGENSYAFDGLAADVFHGGEEDGLILENRASSAATAEYSDCLGRQAGRAELAPGEIRRLPVPAKGLLRVRAAD